MTSAGAMLLGMLVLLGSAGWVPGVHALKVSGWIKSPNSWQYLARFCFLPTNFQTASSVKGQLKARFRFREDSRLTLLEYLERPGEEDYAVSSFDNWADVITGDTTCSERMEQGLAFPLWDPSLETACKRVWMYGGTSANSPAMTGEWGTYSEPVSGSETYGGRRIYSKPYNGGYLFIFFKGDEGKWFVSRQVGSNMMLAQAKSLAMTPAEVGDRWEVADNMGGFMADPEIRVACMDNLQEGLSPETLFNPPAPGAPPPPIVLGLNTPPRSTSQDPNITDAYAQTIKGLRERAGIGLVPDKDGYVTAERTQSFSSKQARWMFLALANCDPECGLPGMCQGSLDVFYELEFTNGEDWSVRQYSADEIGVAETEIFFFVLQIALMIFGLVVRHRLYMQSKYHLTVQLLNYSVGITLIANFFDLIHYLIYSSDGHGVPNLHVVSVVLTAVSEAVLLLLVVLVAKGWTITCRKLSATGRVKIGVYTTLYLFLNLAAIFWYYNGVPKEQVVYLYHTGPGYLVCMMRVVGVAWVVYSTYVTLLKFETKRRFFKRFAFVFSAWLLGLPVVVLIAMSIPSWVRAKVVLGLELSLTAIAQLTLLALYNPASYNMAFPFHATTNMMNAPSGPQRMVVKGAAGEDGLGNTRMVSSVLGGRAERQALSAAISTMGQLQRDVTALQGALEQLESAADELVDDFAHDEEPHGSTTAFTSLTSSMAGSQLFRSNSRAANYNIGGGGGGDDGAAPMTMRQSIARGGGGSGASHGAGAEPEFLSPVVPPQRRGGDHHRRGSDGGGGGGGGLPTSPTAASHSAMPTPPSRGRAGGLDANSAAAIARGGLPPLRGVSAGLNPMAGTGNPMQLPPLRDS